MTNIKSHTGFRNGNLFCFNCGESFKMEFPMKQTMATALIIQFDKDHKKCDKTWVEPTPDPSGKTEEENINWWLLYGERGISSETMLMFLSETDNYKKPSFYVGHPWDPDDFSRCVKLLEAVPQFKVKLDKMRDVSRTWARLVDNWDKLTELYNQAVLSNNFTQMCELMKKIC